MVPYLNVLSRSRVEVGGGLCYDLRLTEALAQIIPQLSSRTIRMIHISYKNLQHRAEPAFRATNK